jgi:hypothetical protein
MPEFHGSNQQWVASQALTSRPENQMRFPWRGVLRGFGLKVGPTTPKTFEAR